MSGATCHKKILCCGHIDGVGKAIDAALTDIVTQKLSKEQDQEVWDYLTNDLGEVIEVQAACLHRLLGMIDRWHDTA